MIGAVVVGTLCTFVMSAYVLPDRPERVLRATIRSLRARMAIVVDTTADAVRTGRLDERRRRRMRVRTVRLNETALMVQSQIEDKVNPGHAVARGQRRTIGPVVVRRRTRRRMGRDRRSACRSRRTGYTRRHPRRTGRRRSPSSRGPSGYRNPTGFGGPRTGLSRFLTSSQAPPRQTIPAKPRCAALPWR